MSDDADRGPADEQSTPNRVLARLALIGGAIAPVSLLVNWLNYARSDNKWPYGSHQGVWIAVGAILALIGLVSPLVTMYRKKTLKAGALTIFLALATGGSVLATAATVSLGAPVGNAASQSAPAQTPSTGQEADGPTGVTIEKPTPDQSLAGNFEVAGRLNPSMRTGDTLWLFVHDGADNSSGRASTHYLQLGPCSVDACKLSWSCPNVHLVHKDGKDRQVTLTVVSVDSAQARIFTQQQADGAAIDQHNLDCVKIGCGPDGRKDPRNYSGLPGGDGITPVGSRTVRIVG